VGTIIDLAAVAIWTLFIGYLVGAWSGFPKGIDAYGHLSQISLLLRSFPDVGWNQAWYSGHPFFTGSYPPLFHYSALALVMGLGVTEEDAVKLIIALSYIAIALGLYGFVRVVTGRRVAALAAVALLIASPAHWSFIVELGHYPRVVGSAFMSLALMFCALAATSKATMRRLSYLGMTIATAASLSSHLLIGLMTLALVVLAGLFMLDWLGRNRGTALAFLAVVSALVSWFYVPYFLGPREGNESPLFTPLYWPVSLISFFTPWFPGDIQYLPPFLLPLGILAVVGLFRHPPRVKTLTGAAIVVGLAVLATFGYTVIGYWPGYSWYILGFHPTHAMFHLSYFLAAFVGMALGRLFAESRGWSLAVLAALLAAIASTVAELPAIRSGVLDPYLLPWEKQVRAVFSDLPSWERNYRVGTAWDTGASWFNRVYDIPQSLGYSNLAALHGTMQFWREYAVWSQRDNYEETDFLLDWYAIRWFYNNPLHEGNLDKFLARPSVYRPMGKTDDSRVYGFEYAGSSPILSASNTETALIIGKDYDLVLRDLSLVNYNSQLLIPVRGRDTVDSYSAEELSLFPVVVLYGYEYSSKEKAMENLWKYVTDGGTLIVETAGSPEGSTASLPDPFPVVETRATDYGTQWSLRASASTVAAGIDLSTFGPGIFAGGPWGLSGTGQDKIKPWARPVLFINDNPVVVEGRLGKGRVVWSGMNLPYHIISYKRPEEARFLTRLLEGDTVGGKPDYTTQFLHPNRRMVDITTAARGVLFKESYYPNWRAYLETDGRRRETTIYKAGPDFMYVPLPPGLTYPLKVFFEYKVSLLERASGLLSAITLVSVILYGLLALFVKFADRLFPGWLPSRR